MPQISDNSLDKAYMLKIEIGWRTIRSNRPIIEIPEIKDLHYFV
jgi:hypothetical protein